MKIRYAIRTVGPKVGAIGGLLLLASVPAGCEPDMLAVETQTPTFLVTTLPGAVGQPCQFSWPIQADDQDSLAPDLTSFPTCAPIQRTDGVLGVNDQACPLDCLEMPSMACDQMICTATAVWDDPGHVNGQCFEEQVDGASVVRCEGYCTRPCQAEADCPAGMRCEPVAPFGPIMACQDPEAWDDACMPNCVPAGEVPTGQQTACPSADPQDPLYDDFASCWQDDFAQCCACLCYQFCPLVEMRFCRLADWREDLFPGGVSQAEDCGP